MIKQNTFYLNPCPHFGELKRRMFGNFIVNPHSYSISVEDSRRAMKKLTISLAFPPSLSKDLIPNMAQGKTDVGHIR